MPQRPSGTLRSFESRLGGQEVREGGRRCHGTDRCEKKELFRLIFMSEFFFIIKHLLDSKKQTRNIQILPQLILGLIMIFSCHTIKISTSAIYFIDELGSCPIQIDGLVCTLKNMLFRTVELFERHKRQLIIRKIFTLTQISKNICQIKILSIFSLGAQCSGS